MTDTRTGSTLREFLQFAKDYKSLWAWVGKAAVAAPLVDLLLNIGPPWPSRLGVSLLVSIVEVVVLMYSFEFWKNSTASARSVRRVMKIGVLLAVALFILYLALFSHYVQDADDSWHRVVIGYRFHPNIDSLVQQNPSKWTQKGLLEEFNNDVDAVWTPLSIRHMQVVILVTWLASWVAIGAVVSSFVSLRWKEQVKRKRTNRKPVADPG